MTTRCNAAWTLVALLLVGPAFSAESEDDLHCDVKVPGLTKKVEGNTAARMLRLLDRLNCVGKTMKREGPPPGEEPKYQAFFYRKVDEKKPARWMVIHEHGLVETDAGLCFSLPMDEVKAYLDFFEACAKGQPIPPLPAMKSSNP